MAERILFVCHANLCRSPMAEYLAGKLMAKLPVEVFSAGTAAVDGHPMHPYAADVAAGTGADPHAFRSRRLSPRHLAEAGLVLAASRRHRALCVSLAPAALHRTFTLYQFARFAESAGRPAVGAGGLLPAVVRAVAEARGRVQPAPPEDDDIRDPVRGTPEDFRRCAHRIETALLPVAALIEAAG
ncbi:low molecular weight phosphatase family protein [Micromonospora sp. PLK6-60]|uniref:arsenate reductase/protein-tyrosine-phosphatase family protein n=1 Tax=Micromonospora sp. PLK6-60 TaxID=2873383 RepID=UPI001CA7706F|nr:low molecular weight phosphatase family protein [Micromonospora sp. PLK6-60]MBY8874722.1 low molecular weight phosphatase family protein [Micromonospora sp. PLK6-60]